MSSVLAKLIEAKEKNQQYLIELVTWENDADCYNCELFSYASSEKANTIVDILHHIPTTSGRRNDYITVLKTLKELFDPELVNEAIEMIGFQYESNSLRVVETVTFTTLKDVLN